MEESTLGVWTFSHGDWVKRETTHHSGDYLEYLAHRERTLEYSSMGNYNFSNFNPINIEIANIDKRDREQVLGWAEIAHPKIVENIMAIYDASYGVSEFISSLRQQYGGMTYA